MFTIAVREQLIYLMSTPSCGMDMPQRNVLWLHPLEEMLQVGWQVARMVAFAISQNGPYGYSCILMCGVGCRSLTPITAIVAKFSKCYNSLNHELGSAEIVIISNNVVECSETYHIP